MSESPDTLNAQRVELGHLLQKAREERNLSLADAEAGTRIRAKYLTALESGDYGSVPSGVATRGFLRNYATFLGLDSYDMMRRFRNALPALTIGTTWVPFESVPSWQQEQRRSQLKLDETPAFPFFAILLVVVVLIAVVVGGWYIYQRYPNILDAFRPQPTATAPSTSVTPFAATATLRPPTATRPAEPTVTPQPPPSPTSDLLPLPTPTPSPLPTDTLTPTPPPAVFDTIELKIRATDRVWLQVQVDGQIAFSGLLEEGQERTWQANEWVRLDVGNAGGVVVILNGTERGSLGSSGEVVRREWTLVDGAIQESDVNATMTAEANTTPTVTSTPRR